MENRKTIVLVLRSGGDFSFRDVELIVRHINGRWESETLPRIICLWDKATEVYDLGNLEIKPLTNDYPGTWSRMILYSPEMEQYRPFLYIDLDTAVLGSLETLINLIPDKSLFITLEDFWERGKLATGLAWVPANNDQISLIWKTWQSKPQGGTRMDRFLRSIVTPPLYFQQLTTSIYDFKPPTKVFLNPLPQNACVVCFHGKPRIYQLAEASMSLDWVKDYVNLEYMDKKQKYKVTVIIPYKVDRGWLKDAIASVPKGVQLLVSQGEGNWPANFNKVLHLAEGKYIKFLHEDDMLTPNCIEDSVKTIEEQGVDFIHGNAYEIKEEVRNTYIPKVKFPTLADLLIKNYIHSATLMYRIEVFEKVGLFDESLNTAEEYEFSMRCLKAGLKIGYCNSFLSNYRRHSAQKVRVVPKELKDNERKMVQDRYK